MVDGYYLYHSKKFNKITFLLRYLYEYLKSYNSKNISNITILVTLINLFFFVNNYNSKRFNKFDNTSVQPKIIKTKIFSTARLVRICMKKKVFE